MLAEPRTAGTVAQQLVQMSLVIPDPNAKADENNAGCRHSAPVSAKSKKSHGVAEAWFRCAGNLPETAKADGAIPFAFSFKADSNYSVSWK